MASELKKLLWGAFLVGLLAAGVWLALALWPRAAPVTGMASAADTDETQVPVPVKVIKPRLDPRFSMTVEEPAYVDPYARADVYSEVAGVIKYLHKDINDRVKAGEVLVRIAVPDLEQEVRQKEAAVEKAKMDLELAQRQVPIALAAVTVDEKTILEKHSEVKEAKATKEYRKLLWHRIQSLVEDKALYREEADERERAYIAAEAKHDSALVAVEKAKAVSQETKEKLEAARADVKLKKSLVAVAERDWDRTKALADYANLRAEFDGTITRRNVYVGSFVQNATTAHTDPLLSYERTDIVTVHMNVPDTMAPYVDENTEAIIEMSELPGQLIHGKVTRFSPALNEADRRMRVEVDLYNGSAVKYAAFLAKERATNFADLKGGKLPLLPTVESKGMAAESHRLFPGMFGKMTLVLRKFPNAYVIPSSAIFSQGGTPYIYEVKNGKAVLLPVEVQFDNLNQAKIRVIEKVDDEEIKKDLTGQEQIVASNQGELSDGQAVTATAAE
jgi:multidrug resistance efflux pump